VRKFFLPKIKPRYNFLKMAEFDKVLWALDNQIQPRDFERLCVDLLSREGYRHIEPSGGTKDNGKDAEICFWEGGSEKQSTIAFQFSLEDRWERKLTEDAKKIAAKCSNIVELVFVTSQRVTGAKKDSLKSQLKSLFGWTITILDREWLRNRLVEFHPDLAVNYFGIELPPTVCSAVSQLEVAGFDEEAAAEIFASSAESVGETTIGIG
jgi:hypothetical protein